MEFSFCYTFLLFFLFHHITCFRHLTFVEGVETTKSRPGSCIYHMELGSGDAWNWQREAKGYGFISGREAVFYSFLGSLGTVSLASLYSTCLKFEYLFCVFFVAF